MFSILYTRTRNTSILGDYVAKIGQNGLDFYSDERWQQVKEAAEAHSFFHWDLEFPDIFYGTDGKRKKNPGFDGVVGNPPYGAKISKKEQEYHKTKLSKVGSTDTAQLMIHAACNLLSKFGHHGFIVPKALVFASNWKKIREFITDDLSILMDCKKVWKDVKLEQVIYIYENNYEKKSYLAGSRIGQNLVADTEVNKKECIPFEFLISGITRDEIKLGQKIYEKSQKLKKYINNSRGCMLQSRLKKNGNNKVIGGAQIQRYYITECLKGYLDTKDIDSDKAYVKWNSILAQRIVAHIDSPTDHLKITATIPPNIDFVILDTINQITVNKINPLYVLGLLNSKIVNWYAYRFIFAKAIRTMQLDNPTTDRIPIIVNEEKAVIDRVKKLLKLYSVKYQNKSTENYPSITTEENKLNHLFYKIFSLTSDEISMVEESTPR